MVSPWLPDMGEVCRVFGKIRTELHLDIYSAFSFLRPSPSFLFYLHHVCHSPLGCLLWYLHCHRPSSHPDHCLRICLVFRLPPALATCQTIPYPCKGGFSNWVGASWARQSLVPIIVSTPQSFPFKQLLSYRKEKRNPSKNRKYR